MLTIGERQPGCVPGRPAMTVIAGSPERNKLILSAHIFPFFGGYLFVMLTVGEVFTQGWPLYWC
ncbi:hypothetical protein [Frankia sp. Cj3]|uniref:hypothetical protein n=1 Tax=Frankia sp. Cj3 TaxID=2880976 RepID=UPI001EF65A7F|nr:hypothetical protein [Frankia sp. Cj3]